MTDEEAAREIDRIIEIMQRHDSVLKKTAPPLICPYRSPTNQQSEAERQTRANASIESPKVPKPITCQCFSSTLTGIKIKQEAPIEPHSCLNGLAAMHAPSAPTSGIVNHGLPYALQWADPPVDTPSTASQADHARTDLRSKHVMSEVERLKGLLAESEAKHKVKDEQLHHLRSELGSSRRTVEDVRGGKLQQLRSELGSARRTISDQELEINKLNVALNHQKELVTVYKQLITTQSMTENGTSRVDVSRPSLKRLSSPEPASDVKRIRPGPAYEMPSKHANGSGIGQQAFSVAPPSKPAFDRPQAPRSFLREQPLDPLRESGQSEFTVRGADFYSPPYSNYYLEKHEIDRYIPLGSVSKGSRDRYIPAYELATHTASTADPDLMHSKPVQALGMVSQSLGNGVSFRLSGEQRPLLPGNAPEAFARAQRLGVPYDPAKHPGIPRKCNVCSQILASGSKLDQHMRRYHPIYRVESASKT